MHAFAVLVVLASSAGAWGLPTFAKGGMMMMGMMGSQKPRMMSEMAANPPPPCCFLPTFEAIVVNLGNNMDYDMVSRVVIDSSKMLEGIVTFSRSLNWVLSHTLIDYNKQMIYTSVHPPTPGSGGNATCMKGPYTEPFVKCLNDSAVTDLTYDGHATAGRADKEGNGVYFDFWRFKSGSNAIDLALAPIKDTGLCYPVFERVKSSTLDNQYWFLDVSETILHPSQLLMPSPCNA